MGEDSHKNVIKSVRYLVVGEKIEEGNVRENMQYRRREPKKSIINQ
jgi:hypothetical protein